MRPLWYEFPGDEVTYGREGSHMLGEALLVTPVLQKSTTQGRYLGTYQLLSDGMHQNCTYIGKSACFPRIFSVFSLLVHRYHLLVKCSCTVYRQSGFVSSLI